VDLERALKQRADDGARGSVSGYVLARGEGWSVEDVICTHGPRDRSFEEQHSRVVIAIVAAGTFQYRAGTSRAEMMTPGSLVLGGAGQFFECGHEHGWGDRCISFGFDPDYFERIAGGCGTGFGVARVPAVGELSDVVARACRAVLGGKTDSFEELGIRLAAHAVELAPGLSPGGALPPGASARVSRVLRRIEREPDTDLSIAALAVEARLSPYHFLRTFEMLTGVTPHRYVLRSRLREAAVRLGSSPEKVLDIALDCGFGDVSNFNRAFRTEFGVNPRAWRTSG